MIASWMVYALVVGALISIAALAVERVLLLLRRPVRWIWVSTLALSLIVPSLGHLLPRTDILPSLVESVTGQRIDAEAHSPATSGANGAPWEKGGVSTESVLLLGWAIATLGLAQLILYSLAVLRGRRREWRRQNVEGVEALVAADFGPAVIGWRHLEIVLPTWVLELAKDARALVVGHELEHVRRQDPRLLIHGTLVVLAMPWNLAVWWQYRRLRRAIELDCDARMVRAGADVALYGQVLLEASGYCERGGLPALASFAERATDLEARIKALTSVPGNWRSARIAGGLLGAGLLMAVACMTPDPLSPPRDISKTAATASLRSLADTGLTTWVRAETQGVYTNGDVVLFRSHEGKLLGSRYVRGATDDLRGKLATGDIEKIEVVKGPAVPNLRSVVVITLKPGKQLSAGMDDSFLRYLRMFTACSELHLGSVTMIRTRDIDGAARCQ